MPFAGHLKLASLYDTENIHAVVVPKSVWHRPRLLASFKSSLPSVDHGSTDVTRHEIEQDRREAQREIDEATREETLAQKNVMQYQTNEESEAEMQALEKLLGTHAHHIGRVANTKYTEGGELDGRDPFIDEPPAGTGQCINPGEEDATEDLSMLRKLSAMRADGILSHQLPLPEMSSTEEEVVDELPAINHLHSPVPKIFVQPLDLGGRLYWKTEELQQRLAELGKGEFIANRSITPGTYPLTADQESNAWAGQTPGMSGPLFDLRKFKDAGPAATFLQNSSSSTPSQATVNQPPVPSAPAESVQGLQTATRVPFRSTARGENPVHYIQPEELRRVETSAPPLAPAATPLPPVIIRNVQPSDSQAVQVPPRPFVTVPLGEASQVEVPNGAPELVLGGPRFCSGRDSQGRMASTDVQEKGDAAMRDSEQGGAIASLKRFL
mmetsp:Transcript_41622/g.75503  ORF Transcript_41622/g.75503 Transcript_41622/m.75503 type:complete len:440 (+) Transcript_41622:37-1356(+)